jgi:uncharacterized protein YbjT (DUF2867 family)
MSDNPPVLIVGGTRGTGLLIARLLERQRVAVRVLARDPVRARIVLGSDVEVWPGDITNQDTLPPAVDGVRHIVFTAGCRSGHPSSEARIKATEYDGVLRTLAEARTSGFSGRFLYMTSSGVATRSFLAACLNLYKGNTLVWRRRTEAAIRESGVDYTIIRAGMLLNRPAGRHRIRLTQEALPLSIRHRIARADVADVFVASLSEPRASRATFEVAWADTQPVEALPELLKRLKSDSELAAAAGHDHDRQCE